MPDLGATTLFYSARPTFRIDGSEQRELREALLALTIRETRDGLANAEASFGAWGTTGGEADILYMDREIFDFGKEIQIDMGEGSLSSQVFSGRITGIEGRFPAARPPQVSVLAEDKLQDMRMTRRTRVFEDTDDAGIFERLAQDHGLTPEIDVDGPQHRAMAQLNLSDLAFLRDRARAVDAEIWVTDGALHVQARNRRQAERIDLTYGRGLHEFSVIADLAHQRTSVTVGGWDTASAEPIEATAGGETVSSAPGNGPSGPEAVEEAFGTREECIVHHALATTDEAQALADAAMGRIARGFLTGRGVAEGDARLRVGTIVNLRGLGGMFDGEYYVTETRHEMDGTAGFRTIFEVEKAKLGV